MRIILRGVAITLTALILAGSALAAPVETVLHSFTGYPTGSDGAAPSASLIADKDGALYGTTSGGGSSVGSATCGLSGCGTVFKLTPPSKGRTAWTETVLYNFCSQPGCSDGSRPFAALIIDEGGALYGTTYFGGSSGNGIVFKLTPPGKGQTAWTEIVLHTFTGGDSDGAYPFSGLIADKQGGLYGTTTEGGSSSSNGGLGFGTVFKLTPPGKGRTAWKETVLYSFKGGSDGVDPLGTLIADQGGALYGTTNGGGSSVGSATCGGSGGCGTVFKLTPENGRTAWKETVLYRFCSLPNCSDGAVPEAGLIADQEGALYGMTFSGGNLGGVDVTSGNGTVFKLMPPGKGQTAWKETVLYRFCSLSNCSDGAIPGAGAGLIADQEGALYGTTSSGGNGADGNGHLGFGTVFRLTPESGRTAWKETVLYRFCSLSNCSDGFDPFSGLITDKQGGLYGTTPGGGSSGSGTVFKLTVVDP